MKYSIRQKSNRNPSKVKAKFNIFLAIWRVPPMIRVYPSSTATVDSKLATLKFLEILEKNLTGFG